MEYKPVANIVVVGAVGDLGGMSEEVLRKVNLSFLANLNDASELEAILKFVFSESCPARFSITIDERNAQQIPSDGEFKWAELLSVILTHPGYLNQGGNYQLFLYPDASTGQHDLSIALRGLFRNLVKQGFEHFAVLDISGASQLSKQGSATLIVPETASSNFDSFNDWYASNLIVAELPLTLIIPKLDWVDRIIAFMDRSGSVLLNNSPQVLQLIQRLRAKSEELNNSINEKSLIADDLKAKKDYLDFLLSKAYDGNIEFGDLARMRKFYYYEYEILPLWYKRFGHIIKVISGKRSFRSLFNDDVKKYKD